MSETFARIVVLVDANEIRVSEHGYDELVEDGISVQDVLAGVRLGVVVEDYPDYPKGSAVLVLQLDRAQRPIHVVWGIPKGLTGPAVLVTAYRPDAARWNDVFTERRK